MLGWRDKIIYLWIKNVEINMRAVNFFEIIYLANIVCRKTCLSLQYLICIRIFQKSVLLCFHSFIHSIGMCRMRWFLAVLRSLLHSLLLYTFSCHPSPPTIPQSSLTSSCHFFLGLPLNLLFFPNSCIILFLIFYLLILVLYSYAVHLVKYFSNHGCAFEIHVVMEHKSYDMTACPGPRYCWTKQNIAVCLFFFRYYVCM